MKSIVQKNMSTAKRCLMAFLCFFVLFLLIPLGSIDADAAQDEEKIVRVGWYQSPRFQVGKSDDGPKMGYSYDFLWNVSDYTSWKYEYVYGEWPELFDMLEKGEIDIMGGVSDTEERRKTLLYPDEPMGTDKYYLYKHSGDKSISAGDITTVNGKKIGLIINNRMSEYALKWIEDNGLNLKLFYYDNFYDMDAAFEAGTVDLVAKTVDNALNLKNAVALVSLGEEPYYMAVAGSREDLLREMNEAVSDMLSIDPYILQDLQYKNFGSSLSGRTVSDEELQWIKQHPIIKVGYMESYLPYCSTDESGAATGLMTDVLESAFAVTVPDNVPEIQYIAYPGYEDMLCALKADEVDIIFPVGTDYWRLESDDINASSEVITDRGILFYKDLTDVNDVKTLAVNELNVPQNDYSVRIFSDAELIYYPDVDRCLDAVVRGEADGTVIDSLRVQYVTGNSAYDSLSYVQLSEITGKSFGVDMVDTQLLLLLNRGIKLSGTSYGYDCSLKYMNSFYKYGALDFIKDHLLAFMLIAGIVGAAVIILLMLHMKEQARELEEKEQLRQKADAASAAKSTFLFNMSHDIRTPMNAVMGFADLMERSLDDPDKLKEYLAKIRFAGEYLLQLINNVLEVARIDSGKDTVDYEFVDLMSSESFVVFENDLKKKNQTFTVDLDITHRYVYTDSAKVREILMNLMSNAIKYTPEGGHIKIEAREFPSEKQGCGRYVMSVIDDGIGMTKEFQEQIFDIFSRERNTTQSGVMGSGLGMAIVKKLVDLLDGTITVESEPGKGSKFTVTIDHKIVENPEEYLEREKEIKKDERPDLTGRRILLAEDNALNAEIAVSMLEIVGAEIEVARDGVECIDMLCSKDAGYYDLILMDIQMPNLNGYDAAKKIRALDDEARASIPIIAMTANAFDEDKKAAMDAGMNGHVAKPIDARKLGIAMMRVLK